MKINPDSLYKIVVNVGNGKVLTYDAKIIGYDDVFITFIDKFNHELTYNNNNVVTITEIKNGGNNGY